MSQYEGEITITHPQVQTGEGEPYRACADGPSKQAHSGFYEYISAHCINHKSNLFLNDDLQFGEAQELIRFREQSQRFSLWARGKSGKQSPDISTFFRARAVSSLSEDIIPSASALLGIIPPFPSAFSTFISFLRFLPSLRSTVRRRQLLD
jgi:hypothetical protein